MDGAFERVLFEHQFAGVDDGQLGMRFKDGAGVQYQLAAIDLGAAIDGAAGHDINLSRDTLVVAIIRLNVVGHTTGRDDEHARAADSCTAVRAAAHLKEAPRAHRRAAIGAAGKHLHEAVILGSGRCASAKDIANTSIDERPNGTSQGVNAFATAMTLSRLTSRHRTSGVHCRPRQLEWR